MMKMYKNYLGIMALAFMLCLSMLIMSGTAFAERCVDNMDGTVTDNGTGLMWQKDTAGPMKWDQAMSYASGLYLGGHSDWRGPNKDELLGLFHSPCKDLMYVQSAWYWTSDTIPTSASDPERAWKVHFTAGNIFEGYKEYTQYVCAVRAAQ